MTESTKALLEKIEQSSSFDDLERSLLSTGEKNALLRCAFARSFDRGIYEKVFRKNYTGSEWPSFESFTQREYCEPISSREGFFRLKERVRREQLTAATNTYLTVAPISSAGRVLREVVNYFADLGPSADLDRLDALLRVSSFEGIQLFNTLYASADRAFDLARCSDLLSVAQSSQAELTDDARNTLADYAAYLRARTVWSSDFFQTAFFHERREISAAFDKFLDDSTRWIWQLHAMGGMGKTMFLRWLVARKCAPAPARFPCARIDFDFFNPATASQETWMLFLRIASQLNLQLAGQPFLSFLQSYETPLATMEKQERAGMRVSHLDAAFAPPNEETRKNIFEGFVARLALVESPVIVVFDTLEEVVLHQQADFLRLLEEMRRVHSRCPKLRLILAGRYELTERFAGFADYALETVTQLLPEFAPSEARAFLTLTRKIDPARPLDLVVARARGNPFKLALFAEILQARPELGAAELKSYPDNVHLIYLIERVLERIEPRARWLLRYGVIPRRLTLRFVSEVMWPYLLEAMSKPVDFDAPERDVSEALRRGETDYWPNKFSADELTPESVWKSLSSYASGYSWVRPEQNGDVLVFHPDVAAPMRELLSGHGVSSLLHREAVSYFEKRAEAEPARWSEWTCEAIYHQFQYRGEAAGEYWRGRGKIAETAGRLDWCKQLAQEVIGSDYVTEDDQPRRRRDGSLLISHESLASAYLELTRDEIALNEANGTAPTGQSGRSRAEINFAMADLHASQASTPVISILDRARIKAYFERSRNPALALEILFSGAQTAMGANTPVVSLTDGFPLKEIVRQALAQATKKGSTKETVEWLGFGIDSALVIAETNVSLAIQFFEDLLQYAQGWETVSDFGQRIHLSLTELYRSRNDFDRAQANFRAAIALAEKRTDGAVGPAKDKGAAFLVSLRLKLAEYELENQHLDDARATLGKIPAREDGALDETEIQRIILVACVYLSLSNPLAALESCEVAFNIFVLNKGGGPERRFRAEVSPFSQARIREVRGVALRELMSFPEAVSELEHARDLWRTVGRQDGVARCLIEMVDLHLDGTGENNRAQHFLTQIERSFTERDRLPPSLRVQMTLAASRLAMLRGDKEQARLSLTQEYKKQSNSPDLTLWIAAQLLALFPSAENLGVLEESLQRVRPASVRASFLIPLRRRALGVLRLDDTKVAERVLSSLLPIDEKQDAWVVRTIAVLPLVQLVGRNDLANALFDRAWEAVQSSGNEFLWRELLTVLPERAAAMPVEIFTRFAEVFRRYPLLDATFRIQCAERYFSTDHYDEGLKVVAGIPAEFAEVSGSTEWPVRLTGMIDVIAKRPFKVVEVVKPPVRLPGNEKRTTESNGKPKPRCWLFDFQIQDKRAQVKLDWEEIAGPRFATEMNVPDYLAEIFVRGANGPITPVVDFWDSSAEEFCAPLAQTLEKLFAERSRGTDMVDLRISVPGVALASFPWELFIRYSGRPLVSNPAIRSVHRLSADALGRANLPPRSKAPRVLILQVSQERQYSSDRAQTVMFNLAASYRAQGIEPFVMEDPKIGEVAGLLNSVGEVCAIHLCGSMRYASEQDVIYFDFAGSSSHASESVAYEGSSLFTSSSLTSELEILTRGARPLVILDVARPQNRYEAMQQIFLRNGYAAEFQGLANFPVLAAGLLHPRDARRSTDTLVSLVAQHRPVTEIASALRTLETRSLHLENSIGTAAVALFLSSADVPPFEVDAPHS